MIPNIFISSTVKDLHYLRDAVRDIVNQLGYNPVMSEYGEIGYLPSMTAEDSCYYRIKECQLVILIIGKRYSSPSLNGQSVTENEYESTVQNKKPIITIVDEEVLSFKKVFELESNDKKPNFPDMDNPKQTFKFINKINSSPLNNGLLPFGNVEEAQSLIKKQLALLFGFLLEEKFDNLKSDISDVLSEIKTLRHIIENEENYNPDQKKVTHDYQRGLRILIDNENRFIYRLFNKAITKCLP